MALTRTTYDVAYLRGDEVVETTVEVWAVDQLRAEVEARRMGLRGQVVDADTRTITDLGDIRNREAVELWAALTRTGQYTDKAVTFRREHLVGYDKHGEETPVDPTAPESSTASD